MWVGQAAMLGDIMALYWPKKSIIFFYCFLLYFALFYVYLLMPMRPHPGRRFSRYQKNKSIILSERNIASGQLMLADKRMNPPHAWRESSSVSCMTTS